MSRKRSHGKQGRILGFLAFSAGTAAAAFTAVLSVAVGIALSTYNKNVDAMQPPEDLLINQPYDGARIYDRNGILLYEFVDEQNGLRRPVSLSEISPYVIATTIATEDATFFTNPGVNLKGLARAAWENFSPFERRASICRAPAAARSRSSWSRTSTSRKKSAASARSTASSARSSTPWS